MPVKYKYQPDQYSSAFQTLGGEDLTGRTAIVTGGNRGIGFQTVRTLAYGGAKVYLGCRSVKSGEAAKKEILRFGNIRGSINVIQLDLTDFGSVDKFTEQFKAKEKYLHYLILNAGVQIAQKRYTQHNFEMHFAVNHIGQYYLQSQLIGIMKQQNFQSRIVILSSDACQIVSKLNLEDMNYRKSFYLPILAYGQTKLCNVYFAQELAERLKETKILVFAVHPGVVDTEMYNMTAISGVTLFDYALNPLFKIMLINIMGNITKTGEQGASSTLYACCAKEIEGQSGGYIVDCQIQQPKPQFKKIEQQQKLWEISERYVEEVNNKGRISF